MSRFFIYGLLFASCIAAQTYFERERMLLLPQMRHVVGQVKDAEGKPVTDARIAHTGDRKRAHQTDSEGRFALDTQAPFFVVRKEGFQSERVRTPNDSELLVTLRPAGRATFANCVDGELYDGIEGGGASFWFRRDRGVTVSPQGLDSHYQQRLYSAGTSQGPKGVIHGSGPLWGPGTPFDLDVWQSVEFEETLFNAGGLTIIDSRGKLPNGTRWRCLGRFGESARYNDMDAETARILDRFLDGACLKEQSRR